MEAGNILLIPMAQYAEMEKEAAGRYPEEACGLVAGKDNLAVKIIAVENELHSQTSFRLAGQGLIQGLALIDQWQLDLLAIYHSHPGGPAYPSAADVAEAYYPDAAALIWAPAGKRWRCRGYRIQNGIVRNVEIRLK
jgi:[CysO sulfur-carrier protein]-S-L-cysteine hydrolase